MAFASGSTGFMADRAQVLAAVRENGSTLQYAPKAFQGDREVVIAAVRQDGSALQYAAMELQCDREVVLTAVRQQAFAACPPPAPLASRHLVSARGCHQSKAARPSLSKEHAALPKLPAAGGTMRLELPRRGIPLPEAVASQVARARAAAAAAAATAAPAVSSKPAVNRSEAQEGQGPVHWAMASRKAASFPLTREHAAASSKKAVPAPAGDRTLVCKLGVAPALDQGAGATAKVACDASAARGVAAFLAVAAAVAATPVAEPESASNQGIVPATNAGYAATHIPASGQGATFTQKDAYVTPAGRYAEAVAAAAAAANVAGLSSATKNGRAPTTSPGSVDNHLSGGGQASTCAFEARRRASFPIAGQASRWIAGRLRSVFRSSHDPRAPLA
mmetsp:Transcript_59312/g.150215  ORF Transcript_59312/g.150215 Transcript_59312/m.150215 type:complete len:391 (-) Transcript_59312:135-1307(-)